MSDWIIMKSYGEQRVKSPIEQPVLSVYSKLINPLPLCRQEDVGFDGYQKPYEFYSAWNAIGEILISEKTPTFLEIGAANGLWAIAFFEWCKLNNKKGEYYIITLLQHGSSANRGLTDVQKYYTDQGYKFKLFNTSSQDPSLKEKVVKEKDKFSIVFIDADHTYPCIMKDIENYAPLASKILIFHDIGPELEDPRPEDIAVYKALKDSNIILDKKFQSVTNHMGIGIKIIQ